MVTHNRCATIILVVTFCLVDWYCIMQGTVLGKTIDILYLLLLVYGMMLPICMYVCMYVCIYIHIILQACQHEFHHVVPTLTEENLSETLSLNFLNKDILVK